MKLRRREIHGDPDVRVATRQPSRRRGGRPIRRSAWISPVSSAIGMNSLGGTRPRWGCCQRSSASKPVTAVAAEVEERLEHQEQLVLWRWRLSRSDCSALRSRD